MAVNRAVALERFGDQYVRAHEQRDGCVYCGYRAGLVLDHVPPLGVVVRATVPMGDLWLYDACWGCNRLLRDHAVACLVLRAEYLLARYRGEWARAVVGAPGRMTLATAKASGEWLKVRLADGSVQRLCRCVRCGPKNKVLRADTKTG